MKVPMLNPSVGNTPYIQELLNAAERVIRGGQYILGKEVELFEEEAAKHIGCKHAIGVSSGSDALIASLIACDVQPGDEVICPSFTFFATAGAIARVGATPVFADICLESFCIDKWADLITSKTRAVIPVHLFGQCADMQYTNWIANQYGITVIEDACQAIGAAQDGKQVGTMGHVGCFSFFPSKNLGGLGDGGLVTTNDDILAETLRMTRNHGARERYYHNFVGGNFRLDALQAALLRVKLKYLPEMEKRRAENALFYLDNLRNIGLPYVAKKNKHVWNQFTIRLSDRDVRDSLQQFLLDNGVGCAVYYPLPLHKQKCFRTTVHLPITDIASDTVLSLPVAPEVTDEQRQYVVDTINKFFTKGS